MGEGVGWREREGARFICQVWFGRGEVRATPARPAVRRAFAFRGLQGPELRVVRLPFGDAGPFEEVCASHYRFWN